MAMNLSLIHIYQQEINGKSRTLLKIRLETGRHHQIRVQLSHEGLPLLGDRKYNPSGEKGTSLGLLSLIHI